MAANTSIDDETISVAGVRLTHPDKGLFTKTDVTKRDLAAYYEAVADRMLPFVENRVLSLVRCPEGQGEECFFQKHPGRGVPGGVRQITLQEASGKRADYLYVSDAAGLVALVQIGTLEIHLWGSSIDDIERPNRLVMDIDPDEGLGFEAVKQAARDIRERLDDLGLKSYAMVTGGKGVHVVAPLDRRREWPEVKAFVRGLAAQLTAEEPDRFIDQASKARRSGRLFVDYLRNERGSTAIAPYSTRAKPGAPVATPVTWKELAGLSKPNGFTLQDILKRARKSDPWAGYFDQRQSITKRALRAVGVEG